MYYLLEDNIIINELPLQTVIIKKQSENVFDLIEQEDLIKIKMGDTFSILEVCRINGGVSGMKHIYAIYKPDSKGNFIKVWEEKDA